MKYDPFLVCRCISRWFSTFAKIAIFISMPYILAIKDRADAAARGRNGNRARAVYETVAPYTALLKKEKKAGNRLSSFP